jgi:hypothetical protein
MTEPDERTPGPDDTAAFQRFYTSGTEQPAPKGLLYRLLVGWWRDKA